MIATVHPSSVGGTITAPPAKSTMQRACALALLHPGKTIISNPGKSDDDLTAMSIARQLGATIIGEDGKVIVQGVGKLRPPAIVNCGESGLSLRMFAPIIALSDTTVELQGSGTLNRRPMRGIIEIFPGLKVKTHSLDGYLPIQLTGPLKVTDISIDGSASSQYLTGLLFAFAHAAKEQVCITVTNLKSKPYIDLSMQMLRLFGYHVTHDRYQKFFIQPAVRADVCISYSNEGDWSNAAFLLVAGAIAGEVTVSGLDLQSLQADRAIIEVLQRANVCLQVSPEAITTNNSNKLLGFQFDATDCPDLFPPLVALAACCDGISEIQGVSRLGIKESDRGAALTTVFTKMGVHIYIQGDAMFVHGLEKPLSSCSVTSHHDHRIAMACAVAALRADGPIEITEVDAVRKSYPDFFEALSTLQVTIDLTA